MAAGGRAIDPNLVNPLTGRVMTGSSSGSCVNILLGINDLAVGTDGGGSVLAPALATGLYSIMAKGLGLKGASSRVSTDSIEFVPGLGVISHSYYLCCQALNHLTGLEKKPLSQPKIVVVRPGEEGMAAVMSSVMAELADKADVELVDCPLEPGRPAAIAFLESVFSRTQLVVSFEGPIDLLGYGDSVLGGFGQRGNELQDRGGKSLLKVANMVDATAVAIPAPQLSCGVMVMAPSGKYNGGAAIELGSWLVPALPLPKLFYDYFPGGWSRSGGGYI